MSNTSTVSARSLFFCDNSSEYTGKGANVLVLDDGAINSKFFEGRFVNICNKESKSTHAARVCGVCAGNFKQFSNKVQGIAFDANIFSADYINFFPNKYSSLIKKLNSQNKIHISAHAYSAIESKHICEIKKFFFIPLLEAQDTDHLFVAASGHMGHSGGVRFPGTLKKAITVGVHNKMYYPSDYCSIDAQSKKPEILVPDVYYAALLTNKSIGKINGSSAAVAIVAGQAALFYEFIIKSGLTYSPELLRGLILANSVPSSLPPLRCISPSKKFLQENNYPIPQFYKSSCFTSNDIEIFSLQSKSELSFELSPYIGTKITITVVLRCNSEIPNKEAIKIFVQNTKKQVFTIKCSETHFVHDLIVEDQDEITIKMQIDDYLQRGYLLIKRCSK